MANLPEISWYFPGTGIPVLGQTGRSRSISVDLGAISIKLSTLAESHPTQNRARTPKSGSAVSTLAEATHAALPGQRLGRARYVPRIRRRLLSLGTVSDLYEAHHIRPNRSQNVFFSPKRVFHRGRKMSTKFEGQPSHKSGYCSSTLALTKRHPGHRTCSHCSPRHTVS
jgi:hypothetical protein